MNEQLLYQWTEEIARHLPSLNSWQVANVGLFTYGIVRAESCQQQTVARQANGRERVESTARRWRRFLDNQRFPLQAFFREWTRWVYEALGQTEVKVLVDETQLEDRIGVIMVGIAWEERCIPLAWCCYEANRSAGYPAQGQVGLIGELLTTVQQGFPPSSSVLVLADRGIGTSPALCRVVEALGWRYLFRVTCQSKICTDSGDYTIARQVQPGDIWAASGRIFKKRGQIPAHARARWALGYEEPWALVTNDDTLTGAEYACRNWQEQGFRDLKSYGWHWNDSRISHPDHMDRLLVLLVIAYTWVLALGGYAVQQRATYPLHREPDGRLRRHWSLFKEGLQFFWDFVQRHAVCLTLVFLPDTRFT